MKQYQCSCCKKTVSFCDYCEGEGSDVAPIDIFEEEDSEDIVCFNNGEAHYHSDDCLKDDVERWSDYGHIIPVKPMSNNK